MFILLLHLLLHINDGDGDGYDDDDNDDGHDDDEDDGDGDEKDDDDAQLGPTSPGWRGQAKYNGWQLATLLTAEKSRAKQRKAEKPSKAEQS